MENKSNIDPMIRYMSKEITVRMLEANFNALPNLLRYVIARSDRDLDARIALNNFLAQAKKEGKALDPGEAVYGFAANIIKLGDGDDTSMEKQIVAAFVSDFCKLNNIAPPKKGWTDRLKFATIPECS